MSDEKPTKSTLLLVDGSSYLYRAFFAGGESMSVTLPDGTEQKTGAIRIMINMMNKLLKEYPSAYAACVFDAKGPTFRDEIYPAYKEQRSPMPDDLRSQIAPIHEVVKLMGWPVLDVPGVEADDVIGTLAVAAAAAGHGGDRVQRRQGSGAAGQRTHHHHRHHERQTARSGRGAGRVWRAGQPDGGLPDSGGRSGGQRARRAQGGPQDRRQMAHRVRLAAGHRGQRRQHQGRRGRKPAPGARLAAHRAPVADHQDRLRSERLGARHAFAGERSAWASRKPSRCGRFTRPMASRVWPRPWAAAMPPTPPRPKRRKPPRRRHRAPPGLFDEPAAAEAAVAPTEGYDTVLTWAAFDDLAGSA